MERNAMGQVIELAAYQNNNQKWSAQMDYNCLGQETRRLVSGGVLSSFEYDKTGRPTQHVVGTKDRPGGGREHRRRRYEWGINSQLKRIINELSGGSVMYSYDSFGSLIGSKADQFEELFRITDEVGNLYERKDRSDRIYGAGSQLEQSALRRGQGTQYQPGGQEAGASKGTRLFYDKEGNLTKKVEAGGDTWFYAYYGNGMLKKVVKPDQSGVYFIYDPFGRRIEKSVSKPGSEDVSKSETGQPLEENPWVQVGGGFIRKPVKKKEDSNLDSGVEPSLYAEESREQETRQYQNVIRFLWSGDTLLHEWGVGAEGKRRLREREGEKADYLLKMEETADQKARAEADKGAKSPKNLITWVFQDNFIPRAKLTEDGSYSIISDYLGTLVEAYDGEGEKVWERELDIYGRVKRSQKDRFGSLTELVGVDGFIPFRYQGQYEDVETGLYYNRFRYYSPSDGCYTQVDPIRLAGGNPTVYGYVVNTNLKIDPFGLDDLYALIAKSAGWYDVMEWGKKAPVGKMFLEEGDLWKIGTSKNVLNRYSKAYLDRIGVESKKIYTNINDATAKYFENQKLRGYEQSKGHLPPGNKCRH